VSDAYFRKGVGYASLGKDEEAMFMLKKALEENLPQVLMTPLHQLRQVRSDFYEKYVVPLFEN
jgi:hypothetical protein